MFFNKFNYIPLFLNHFTLIQSIKTMSSVKKEFPKTLAGFGYGFNNGKCILIASNLSFAIGKLACY